MMISWKRHSYISLCDDIYKKICIFQGNNILERPELTCFFLLLLQLKNNKTIINYQLYFITNDKIYPKIWCDPMIGNAMYHLPSIKYTSHQKYVCINEFFSFLCFFIFFSSNFTYIVDLTYNTPNETRHGKLKIFF